MQKYQQTELPKKYTKNFIERIDGRFQLARELRATSDNILSDMGGSEQLSTVQLTLVEKFCWLSQLMRQTERQIAASQDPAQCAASSGAYVQMLNSLIGLSKTIGLQRKARKADLRSYLEGVRK